MRARRGSLAVVAFLVAACGYSPGPHYFGTTDQPTATPSAGVSVDNETTIPVTVSVNGTLIATVPAGTMEDPIPAELPARPWMIEARSASGRLLATLTVRMQDVISSTSGDAVREDLTCGRLDMWSGPPMLGPMFSPDPSKPCG
jgi:hypothetical protein